MRSDSGNGTVTGDQAGDADPYGGAPRDPAHPDVPAQLRAIREQLAVLTDREQERAEHREAVIDRLHAENQALRRQELELMLEPVRAALYRLHDVTSREAVRWSAAVPPEARHAGPLLTMIADEVIEVLARTGVEPFTPRSGEPYDAARHRPVDTEPVADPRLDGTVNRTLSTGFHRGEWVARRAEVVVGQLESAGPRDRDGVAVRTEAPDRGGRHAGPDVRDSTETGPTSGG